ncbi:MAG: PD-(D/E)XK nuclease-like domain-containing protein [Flavisolibacter sp.]
MVIEKDPYYSLPEVSNSDLSWIKKYWQMQDEIIDLEKAYRFGTLIDCMITEPQKVNYFNHTCAGVPYTNDEFALAEEMKKSFWRDEFCATLARHSEYQKVSIRHNFPIEHDGLQFTLNVRCKWDLYAMPKLKMSGDIKSTACTTQKQFEEAIRYFDYDRQRAIYMDIENVDYDMLIGISKVNKKIFKVPVRRGSDLYNSGRQKYQELAFRYWYLFDNIQ